jgi:hypothetical protein
MLRTILHYVPLVAGLEHTITDLWVRIRHPNAMRWTACYGVACAKLLARLGPQPKGQEWSLING